MISLHGVSVYKDQQLIVDALDLQLDDQRVAVIGRNGSGKSTFAKLLNGIQEPSSGLIKINNKPLPREQLRRHVGFVFQNPDNQIVFPIVAEDLAFGLQGRQQSTADIAQQVDDILAQFSLQHLKERFTHELSGGEKQLVALLGVLLMKPDYIVFDEPTTLLDLPNKNKLIQVMSQLPQAQLVVTHDLQFASEFARVLLFDDGRIVADGEPDLVIEQYHQACQC